MSDDTKPEEQPLDQKRIPPLPDEVLAVLGPSKTPLFQATHAARYQRQALIKDINEATSTRLISYVAGLGTMINRDDTVPLVDLLHNVPEGKDLDLLLHTGGGDIDAAEKLVSMMRQRVGSARLRVIVPDFAKSAGTLIALGADAIVMSDTSELGPIDPQIVRYDTVGNGLAHSVLSYLDAYEHHAAILKTDPGNVASQIMMSKMDPGTQRQYEAIRDRARRVAEDLLQQGMFKETGNWSLAVTELLNTKNRPSHGQMISWQDAVSPKLGLVVEHVEWNDPIWRQYWLLYCLQRLAITESQKLFESDFASLVI
jgi:hypothetical protein